MTPSGQAAIDTVAALAGWATKDELVADVTPLIEQAEAEARAAALREVAEKVRPLADVPHDHASGICIACRRDGLLAAILTEVTGASE